MRGVYFANDRGHDMFHRTFTAELLCTTPGYRGRVGLTESPQSSMFSGAEDGWLAIKGHHFSSAVRPIVFRFDYREHSSHRVLYDITCASAFRDFQGGVLDVSRNGYVGIYSQGSKGLLWKVEVLGEWDGTVQAAEQLDIYLRDKDGNRLSLYKEPLVGSEYLNVQSGTILTFRFGSVSLV